jgi:tetratricopeptide (TPR) repeat protein
MKPYTYHEAHSYGAYLGGDSGVDAPPLGPWVEVVLGSPNPTADWPSGLALAAPAFSWRECEQLAESEVFDVPLGELKNSAKTTAEMWAAEQFCIARDAWRRGLRREALDYLHRAISGRDGHEGYALDFRCHFLIGLIHLGSAKYPASEFLDLDKAEQAFARAGSYSVCDHPADATRAFFAAGWAAYCQGRMEDALRYTQQSLTLSANFAPAQYQAAKILVHQQMPDAAQPYLVRAVSLNPYHAVQACLDADFAPFQAMVRQVIEHERDSVGRRASQAIKDLMALAQELGVDVEAPPPPAEKSGRATAEPAELINLFTTAARVAFGECNLFSYLRAEAATAAGLNAVSLLRVRLRNERQAAEDALRTAQRELAEVTELQLGSYRVSELAAKNLEEVRTHLEEATKHFATGTLPGYVHAETRAKCIGPLLKQAIERCRDLALRDALDKYEALQQDLAELRRRQSGSGGSIRGFALVGALIALYAGTYLSYFSLGLGDNVRWSEVALRFTLSVLGFAGAGAVIGALLAPLFANDAPVINEELERRLATLREAIATLHAFPVDPHSKRRS